MKRIIAILGSTRLFLILLGLLLIGAGIAVFSPGFSGTVPFILVLALMEINLLLCTLPRLVRRRTLSLVKLAPDIIHLGIAFVLAGGIVSFTFRVEERYFISTGDEVTLPDGITAVTVLESTEEMDDAGNVTGWSIELGIGDERYGIGPNKPIRIGAYRIYFLHWGMESIALFREGEELHGVYVGEGFRKEDGGAYIFSGAAAGPSQSAEIVAVDDDGQEIGRFVLQPRETLGAFRFEGLDKEVLNGFTARHDPGRSVILLGLLLLIAGMVFYGVGKWRKYG